MADISSRTPRPTPLGRARRRLRAAVLSLRHWVEQNIVKTLVGTIVLTMTIIVLWPHCVVFIPSGHAGVLWSRFFGGTVMDRIYRPGAHLILPWDQMTVYDMRVQLANRELDVLTADGLHSTLDIAFRFKLDAHNLTILHEFIGPNYLDKVVVTDISTETRRVVSQYLPDAAFTEKRAEIEEKIQAGVKKVLEETHSPHLPSKVRLVYMHDVMIRSVKLPPEVAQAIERKVQEYHRAEQYKYTLEAERQEAERKKIEAEGIRIFQDTVRPGLSDGYLRWRGIEATLALAKSDNSKTVIIGAGQHGLPVILGADDGAARNRGDKGAERTPAKGAADRGSAERAGDKDKDKDRSKDAAPKAAPAAPANGAPAAATPRPPAK